MNRLAGACFILLASAAQAYVTSAQLEYSVDDFAEISLNGQQVLPRSEQHWADYAVLSTSDGTLPLKYFNFNGENILAIKDSNVHGRMSMSYRLTVKHSQGDPVVVWGDSTTTRFLHLSRSDRIPDGWTLPKFDDSRWERPVEVDKSLGYFLLNEPRLKGFFGTGFVPHLGRQSNGEARDGDNDLYRSRFTFPYTPARTQVLVNPAQAKAGDKVAVRLVPGDDAPDVGAFKLFADLPAGLEPFQRPAGGGYDPAKRRLSFDLDLDKSVRYLRLPLASVVSAPGWSHPEKAVHGDGPVVSQDYKLGFESSYWDAAEIIPGAQGVFRYAVPPAGFPRTAPKILGVIFHCKASTEGQNGGSSIEADELYFNYSLSPDSKKALARDVMVGRTGTRQWYDGYYDATEDRPWSWQDLSDLKAVFQSRVRGRKDKSWLAGAWVVVKCFDPSQAAPVFYAAVSAVRCGTLELDAGIESPRFAVAGRDQVQIPVNLQACPTATATPLPRATLVAARPVSTPQALSLGCLSSSPEPFRSGGVFVKFCLKQPARLAVEVYASSGGAALRHIQLGECRAGDGIFFFNGLDDEGLPLKAGPYLYIITATSHSGASIQRHESFSKIRDLP